MIHEENKRLFLTIGEASAYFAKERSQKRQRFSYRGTAHLLSIARQRPERHLKQVLHCTRGIVFLGTPHYGSGLAHWAEGLAKTIGVLKQTNPQILAVLRSDSEVLARVQDGFHTMIRSRVQDGLQQIEITCFYEELPLPGIAIVGLAVSVVIFIELILSKVVPSRSAILPGYILIGIRSNHMDMSKFEDVDDPGFAAVVGELRRWTRELARSQKPEIDARRDVSEHAEERNLGQILRITQSGSQFGSSTVNGGTLRQGNFIGGV